MPHFEFQGDGPVMLFDKMKWGAVISKPNEIRRGVIRLHLGDGYSTLNI